jgi:hypothetical protein
MGCGCGGWEGCKAVDIWRFRIGGRSLAGHYRDGQFISRVKGLKGILLSQQSTCAYSGSHVLIFSNTRDYDGLSS